MRIAPDALPALKIIAVSHRIDPKCSDQDPWNLLAPTLVR